jgi:hypothetical protein
MSRELPTAPISTVVLGGGLPCRARGAVGALRDRKPDAGDEEDEEEAHELDWLTWTTSDSDRDVVAAETVNSPPL